MEGKEKNTQMPVVRLGRQLKYEGNILKTHEDGVLTNGHEARWDSIHRDGTAAVLPVVDSGEILMVRQYRNVLGRYTLEIPTDKLDEPGEPKVECAFWKLEEETGYRVESPENLGYLMSLTTTVALCDEVTDIFVVHNLTPSHQHLNGDEMVNVVPCSLGELEDMVYTGKTTDGRTIATIMVYVRKYHPEDKKGSMVRGQAINHELLPYSNGGEAVTDMFLTCKLGQEDDTWE